MIERGWYKKNVSICGEIIILKEIRKRGSERRRRQEKSERMKYKTEERKRAEKREKE